MSVCVSKRSVFCTFQFEAFHNWPKAPEEVAFLRAEHRHIFHVKAEVEVTHNDRDIEFILLKRHMEASVPKMLVALPSRRSCEDMAEWFIGDLFKNFAVSGGIKVTVSEDGENGATVYTHPA